MRQIDRVLAAVREKPDAFRGIALRSGVQPYQTASYLTMLKNQGFVRPITKTRDGYRFGARVYEATDATGSPRSNNRDTKG